MAFRGSGTDFNVVTVSTSGIRVTPWVGGVIGTPLMTVAAAPATGVAVSVRVRAKASVVTIWVNGLQVFSGEIEGLVGGGNLVGLAHNASAGYRINDFVLGSAP